MFKMVLILMSLLLLVCPLASAESMDIVSGTIDDFSIRNGIHFLMTKDEVEEYEDLQTTPEMYSAANMDSLEIKGTFAGIENSTGRYGFDENSMLVAFEYSFYDSAASFKTRDERINDYNYIESSLSEKYGQDLSSPCIITSKYMLDYISKLDSFNLPYGILDMSERLLKNNSGGYIKIEHWIFYINHSSNSPVEDTGHLVQYTYYSDDDIEAVMANVESNKVQRDNDL